MPCPECGVDVRGYSACPGCGTALAVTVSAPSLPDEPWELTAPESYVLRYGLGDRTHALHGFKLALQELVARQALTVQGAWVRRRWAPGRYPTFLLCDGPRKAEVKERSLRTVVGSHTHLVERRASHGVPFSDPEGAVGGVLLERFVADAARRDGDAFWSLTATDTVGYMVSSPTGRSSVDDHSGLVTEPDGSVDILLQPERRAGPHRTGCQPRPVDSS